ncbi:hypothetical protein ACFZDK_09435 [Streptomyces sp. NPDC007901]|uniref:hypothetical protein n=1 Tax=Streptomyces sp. NPDC007901 TaxID=3364785 RepID=UPI0036F14066
MKVNSAAGGLRLSVHAESVGAIRPGSYVSCASPLTVVTEFAVVAVALPREVKPTRAEL